MDTLWFFINAHDPELPYIIIVQRGFKIKNWPQRKSRKISYNLFIDNDLFITSSALHDYPFQRKEREREMIYPYRICSRIGSWTSSSPASKKSSMPLCEKI